MVGFLSAQQKKTGWVLDKPVASVISLSKMGTFDNYQKVTADIKVLKIMEPINVSGGKKKRM